MAAALQSPSPYVSKAWHPDTLIQACKQSNEALEKSLPLSHFLSHHPVENLFLICGSHLLFPTDGFHNYPFLVESLSVGEAWGTHDMMLDLVKLTADQRKEYLRAAASFPGAVYLVDTRLTQDEALEWWEALRLAQTTPHSLFFQYEFLDYSPSATFYVDSEGKSHYAAGYAFAGKRLMDVLNCKKGIKNLTIYNANLDFNEDNIAGIATLHSLHLEGVVVSSGFLEALVNLENPSSCIKKLTLSSVHNKREVNSLSDTGPPTSWHRSFHRLLQWKLEQLALINFKMDISDLMDFMQSLKGCSNSALYSLALGISAESRYQLHNITDGMTSEHVGALVDALDQSGLPFLELDDRPLDAAIEAQLLRNQQKHSNVLKQQLHRKVPATALRLFICGDAYAGKFSM